jgi:hypothetical protein
MIIATARAARIPAIPLGALKVAYANPRTMMISKTASITTARTP